MPAIVRGEPGSDDEVASSCGISLPEPLITDIPVRLNGAADASVQGFRRKPFVYFP